VILERWIRAFGTDLATVPTSLKGLRRFWADYLEIKKQNATAQRPWAVRLSYPCLTDFYDQPGVARGHYFHQDLLVAQKIFARNPTKHVDIGSRIDGFVAHVASFREIEVWDRRELSCAIPNVIFRQSDIVALSSEFCSYCDSLSCLHVIEHIGLGRYGDPIDIDGHQKALASLSKMLQTGGTLYLSLPFGREQIEFNAHRLFSLATIRDMIRAAFEVMSFSLVDDSGDLHQDDDLERIIRCGREYSYALAILELRKRNIDVHHACAAGNFS
jgi:hypothetical protein